MVGGELIFNSQTIVSYSFQFRVVVALRCKRYICFSKFY